MNDIDRGGDIMDRYPNAAAGLRLMFVGQLLMIAGVALIWVPLVGSLLTIGGIAAEGIGIYKAGIDDENYRGALVFVALALVVDLIAGFVSRGLFGSLLDVAGNVLNLLVVFTVCNTTSNLLHSIGNEALSDRGGTVVKIYTGCTVISIVCGVLSIVPIINIAVALVSIVSAIVLVIGYVMYLFFLNDSSRSL